MTSADDVSPGDPNRASRAEYRHEGEHTIGRQFPSAARTASDAQQRRPSDDARPGASGTRLESDQLHVRRRQFINSFKSLRSASASFTSEPLLLNLNPRGQQRADHILGHGNISAFNTIELITHALERLAFRG